MELFVRRVYLWVITSLILLWVGMIVWTIHSMKPQLLSSLSAPAPPKELNLPKTSKPGGPSPAPDVDENPGNNGPLPQTPGIRFSYYHPVVGDTYALLAQQFHLQEPALRSLNQANDNSQPEVGTPLLIPSKDGIYHIVRPGQSLADISRAYGSSIQDILKTNALGESMTLKPGDILYLPDGAYLTRQDVRWIALNSLTLQKGFLKPTTGRFSEAFGERNDPISHKPEFHGGLDLAPGKGARVFASQDGQVLYAGIRAGYGRLIILDHGEGLTSWYAHLDEILVKPRQQVKRGDLIGKVGNTGHSTGPHLHFEIRLHGKPQNPFLYLVQ